jgi:carbamoyltransferase
MTVLIGWQNDLNASATLLVDGTVVGAVEEERFTRVKQQEGFPWRSVEWLLEHAGLTVADVDEWVYGWFQGANSSELLPGLCERVAAAAGDEEAVRVMVDRIASEQSKDEVIRARGMREALDFGVPEGRITLTEHHPTHAWSAFACSPFEKALVVTADGRGDRKSITVSLAGPDGLTETEWYSSIDSLGHIYSQVTHVLGFRPNRHEGKITGLAARGDGAKAKEFLRTLVDWDGDRIVARAGARFRPSDRDIPEPTRAGMKSFAPEDLAAGVQDLIEELFCELIASRVERFGLHDVALAGGVFANVKLNQRIRELPGVERVYVQPNMGDGGLSLGSVAAAWHRISGEVRIEVRDMFLGPEPGSTPGDVGRTPQVTFADEEEAVEWIARAVTEGKVVGLVRGACEFGPRALCHRSLIAEADDPAINDLLNKRLNRTEFMPFAPVLRAEDAAGALIGWDPEDPCAPYMTMAYSCSPEFTAAHPAVVHVDGTARPQIVTAESDPFMHEVLGRAKALTGRSALINTSFNRHEEPIVLTLDDALGALDDGSVDVVCTESAAWLA